MLGYNFDVSSSIVQGATSSFCEVFMNYVKIDEHATTVLNRLHSKYKLGVISNFAIPECVHTILKNNGLDSFLDLVIISAAVNKRKPSPEIFEGALKFLNLSAAEAAFVGDTMDADIAGAKAVGMKAIYLKRRIEKEIVDVCPDLVIDSLVDLPSSLEK
jgi:putative hydrolase of the HAD superfamily